MLIRINMQVADVASEYHKETIVKRTTVATGPKLGKNGIPKVDKQMYVRHRKLNQ